MALEELLGESLALLEVELGPFPRRNFFCHQGGRGNIARQVTPNQTKQWTVGHCWYTLKSQASVASSWQHFLKYWHVSTLKYWHAQAMVRPIPLLPSGSPFGDPGPHGDLFQFLGPQKVPISFPRSPFSPFQAEERAKSQSSHCLLNVDHLNTCDDKTSLNEYHASLSVKLNFLL